MIKVKPKVDAQNISVSDLYAHGIHGITFTLIERALGAKVYGKTAGAELRLNFEGHVKLVRLSLAQLKEFKDTLDFLYRVVKEKEGDL